MPNLSKQNMQKLQSSNASSSSTAEGSHKDNLTNENSIKNGMTQENLHTGKDSNNNEKCKSEIENETGFKEQLSKKKKYYPTF